MVQWLDLQMTTRTEVGPHYDVTLSDVPWVSTLLTRSCRNRPDLSEGPLQKINHPTVTGNLMLGRPRLADFCLPNWNVGTNCNETGQNLADVTNEISECWPL